MHIYVFVCMYIDIFFACMYINIYVHVFKCIHICIHAYILICMYTNMYKYTYIQVYIYPHTHAYKHVCICIHKCMYTYTYIYMYLHKTFRCINLYVHFLRSSAIVNTAVSPNKTNGLKILHFFLCIVPVNTHTYSNAFKTNEERRNFDSVCVFFPCMCTQTAPPPNIRMQNIDFLVSLRFPFMCTQQCFQRKYCIAESWWFFCVFGFFYAQQYRQTKWRNEEYWKFCASCGVVRVACEVRTYSAHVPYFRHREPYRLSNEPCHRQHTRCRISIFTHMQNTQVRINTYRYPHVYVNTYVGTRVWEHGYVYTYTHVYAHRKATPTRTRTHAHTHTHIHTHTHTYVQVLQHMLCMHIHIWTHTHTPTHKHAHTYICRRVIRVCMGVFIWAPVRAFSDFYDG